MPNTILFGQGTIAAAYRYDAAQPDDNGTPVLLRASTAVFAPAGWEDEALHRIAALIVSANVGTTVRCTPFLEGVALDGQSGRPDARVTFTLAPPAPGERTLEKVKIGLFQPVRVNGVVVGRTGLRGTWIQLLLETLTAIVIPVGDVVPDLRFDGVSIQWEPLHGRQQVTNA